MRVYTAFRFCLNQLPLPNCRLVPVLLPPFKLPNTTTFLSRWAKIQKTHIQKFRTVWLTDVHLKDWIVQNIYIFFSCLRNFTKSHGENILTVHATCYTYTPLYTALFQNFITKQVPGYDTKVYCKFCKCELTARYADLIIHSKTNKHTEAAKPFSSQRQQKLSFCEQHLTSSAIEGINGTFYLCAYRNRFM